MLLVALVMAVRFRDLPNMSKYRHNSPDVLNISLVTVAQIQSLPKHTESYPHSPGMSGFALARVAHLQEFPEHYANHREGGDVADLVVLGFKNSGVNIGLDSV